MKIDLHGKTHPESLELIEEYMLLNSVKGSVSLHVITGNSPVMQKKIIDQICDKYGFSYYCLLYTSPSPRDLSTSRMPSSA